MDIFNYIPAKQRYVLPSLGRVPSIVSIGKVNKEIQRLYEDSLLFLDIRLFLKNFLGIKLCKKGDLLNSPLRSGVTRTSGVL